MKKVLLSIAMTAFAAPAFAATPSQVLPANGGGANTSLYHSYDGLICTDCHTLHNSEENQGIAGAKGTHDAAPNQALLKKANYTDICLSCHKEGVNTAGTADMNGVAVIGAGWTAPIVMTANGTKPDGVSMPAGDFYYSKTDPKKGHNPAYSKGDAAATSANFPVADAKGKTPPGNAAGALADEWSCHSCHGMHSRFSDDYVAYRQLLRKVNGVVTSGNQATSDAGVDDTKLTANVQDANYEPIKSNSRGNFVAGTFNFDNHRKDGHDLEGADLLANPSDSNKNVYRGGFSSYCAACHGDFHGGGDGSYATQNTNVKTAGNAYIRHPTNLKLSASSASKYGVAGYTKQVTASQAAGSPNPTGYDWKYPLVVPDADFAAVTRTATTGLNADSRMMCLTCHKAHATQYDNAVRWDPAGHAFLPGGTADFEGQVDARDNIAYGCGKCHQKGGAAAYVKSF